MSYDEDKQLLEEYQEWKAKRKVLLKDESVETFLVDRFKEAAFDNLLNIDRLYETYLQDREQDIETARLEFITGVAKVLEELN